MKRIDTSGVDAIVLSACVQMPSLAAIQIVEDALGVPVISSAVATAWQMLKALDLEPIVPDAGRAAVGDSLGPAVIRRDDFSKEMGSLAGCSSMSSLRRIWWLATSPAAGAAAASLWTSSPMCALDASARSCTSDCSRDDG